MVVLLPLALVAVTVWADLRHERRTQRLFLAQGVSRLRRWLPPRSLLVAVAVVLVGAALTGSGGSPEVGVDHVGGPDVLLLMDVSRSMSASDVAPDRQTVARLAALRVATGVQGLRVGVAGFAGEAYLLLPPTADGGLVALYLQSLDQGVVSGQGSDLGKALALAVEEVAGPEGGGAVVVFSDGEGFEEEGALAGALAEARRLHVPVNTVLVGTEGGAVLDDVVGRPRSLARPATLSRIADETGGVALRAADGAAIARLASALAGSGRERPDRSDGAPGPLPHESWLALGALMALIAESAVGVLRPPRLVGSQGSQGFRAPRAGGRAI